jgi:hypothetical protein
VTGVQENDVIVVDGKQNLRPGVKVVERPKEAAKDGGKPDAVGSPGSTTVAPANAPGAAPAATPAPAAAK